MIQSDKDIKNRMESGDILITPMPKKIDGSSIDLTLSNVVKLLEDGPTGIIDTRNKNHFKAKTIEFDDYYDIVPGAFLLAATNEYIKLSPKFSAFVQGRSSWARIGLGVEIAGFIDAGFEGTITLEVFNMSNNVIRVYKNQRICQMIFFRMESEPEIPYNIKESAKYNQQVEPEISRIYDD